MSASEAPVPSRVGSCSQRESGCRRQEQVNSRSVGCRKDGCSLMVWRRLWSDILYGEALGLGGPEAAPQAWDCRLARAMIGGSKFPWVLGCIGAAVALALAKKTEIRSMDGGRKTILQISLSSTAATEPEATIGRGSGTGSGSGSVWLWLCASSFITEKSLTRLRKAPSHTQLRRISTCSHRPPHRPHLLPCFAPLFPPSQHSACRGSSHQDL